MNTGLKEDDLKYIINVIKDFDEIEKAVVFGSRAEGSYKRGSDVDIAIYGEGVSFDTISTLKAKLEEEGPLPYFFDVVDYYNLENQDLKEHIDRVGKVIFPVNF
ncbi:DNA polymerase, beta domain protein region [Alkaliphilus metalliredigens QYMF]|uniref:DNA polymerase, beta domain protein region n=1 Tax=Alkaliphilus metalliredigens (strain QYMF) TaxID=293826 RepID=A6TL97_ALKMQ|nr:nucleotidyltransferase domain-containing protein [Alkaliphilus metalliredigens]ABR46965.1 DNA polymerase, beta domain protein region [Alkaliphilus metalliredigens QYMF]